MEKCEYEKEWNELRGRDQDYPPYHLREQVKDIAWRLIAENEEIKDLDAAAFYLVNGPIWSHYWRTREYLEQSSGWRTKLKKILGKKKYQPGCRLEFNDYACHWLFAMGDRRDLFSDNLMEIIENEYCLKPIESKYLRKGYTQYNITGKY